MDRRSGFLKAGLLALGLMAATPVWGGLIFTTNPVDGVLSGTPGQTVGWGFTFTASDANYYVLSNVFFCIGAQMAPTCPDIVGVGAFTDIAAGVNGLIIVPTYSASPYSEIFSAGVSGLGSYTISASAAIQAVKGSLYVYFDTFNGDPAGTGTQIGSNSFITRSAEVDVTPEPGSLTLIGLGLAGAALLRRKSAAGWFQATVR